MNTKTIQILLPSCGLGFRARKLETQLRMFFTDDTTRALSYHIPLQRLVKTLAQVRATQECIITKLIETDVLYEPENEVPQIGFEEGVFIDYRHLDRANKTPTYEFGFGLSYTTFEFSNLQITKRDAGAYTPTTGNTPPAPTYGTISNDTSQYLRPDNFTSVPLYVYPWINSTNLKDSAQDPNYGVEGFVPEGAQDGSPQPLEPAGGASGGNSQLWDVLYTVTATITNTGSVAGQEVPQLVSHS